jgi:hypothetical protein
VERYLVFDAGCSVCSRLAQTVQEAVGDQLEAINIREDKARTLLATAFPDGWAHAPYLVTVHHGTVQAQTGLSGAVRLALLMGPRKAWHVWRLARQSGAVLPTAPVGPLNPARRQLLKLGAAVAAVSAMAGWGTVPAFACSCSSTYCVYNQIDGCGCNASICSHVNCTCNKDYFQVWDCYSTDCPSLFCYSEYRWSCNSCPCPP